MTANVFEVKRFAVHDGDGIRTTVFLKGCPLKCVWCHNPEGISPKPQLAVLHNKCTLCGRCEAVCSNHRITDTHILNCGGKLTSLVTPIKFGDIISSLNWKVQWNFVFKRTIPLFWIPAHTITFMLPAAYQVLFAASLSIVLGLLLSIAAVMSNNKL